MGLALTAIGSSRLFTETTLVEEEEGKGLCVDYYILN